MASPTRLVACPSCGCYARFTEANCPHCDAAIRRPDGSVAPTKAAIFLGLAVLVAPLATLASCSDGAGGGSAGAGGAGGEGSVSSAGGASASTSNVTTATTTTVSTYATGPTTTTSSGAQSCDDTGDCGDNTSGCIGCALGGNCADALNTCGADAECVAFSDCIGACDPADDACFQACIDASPSGASLYNDLVFCVICEECYNDCDGAGSGC